MVDNAMQNSSFNTSITYDLRNLIKSQSHSVHLDLAAD